MDEVIRKKICQTLPRKVAGKRKKQRKEETKKGRNKERKKEMQNK